MRLLIVTQAVDLDDPVLGFFHSWIEEFSKHCESIIVICLKEGRHELSDNVRVYSLGKPSSAKATRGAGERVRSRLRYLWTFYSYIWRFRHEYDAVFVHMNPEYIVLGGWLWRMLGKTVGLWYVHRSVTPSLRVAVLFVHRVFTASVQSFRLDTRKLQIVGHGIDVSLFPPHAPVSNTVRILTLGRISAAKRVMEMVVAVEELVRRGRDVTFTIHGAPAVGADFSYESELIGRIARSPARTRISYAGPVAHAEIPVKLLASSVFLNLSTTGSLDKAVLEAFAARTPVVTSNEAFAEIVTTGLYLSSLSPKAIADALESAHGSDASSMYRYVCDHHNLNTLVVTIMSELSKI